MTPGPADPPLPTMIVGAYTPDGGGRGAGVTVWSPTGGGLTETSRLELASPSYLIPHRTEPWLFAVSETSPSSLTSLRIEPAGQLARLSSVPTDGDAACHLAWSPDGRHLVVAHYGSGSVSSVGLGAEGQLSAVVDRVQFEGTGPDPDRQTGPHAHQVVVDRAELLVADLGSDRVHRLTIDDAGRFATVTAPVRLPPGSGPRHLVVIEDHLVVACELSGEVWVGVRTPDGWRHTQTVPASGRTGPTAVPSAIRAADDLVFVANRGVETVAAFRLDPVEHRLSPVQEFAGGGAEPRDLVVTPDRLWLANQNADLVCVFDRAPDGSWRPDFQVPTPSPACIVLRPRSAAIA